MELDRKEFHFDLDVDSLKLTYSDHDSSSWNAAWSDIRELLEEHGFEKPQYSGYESADKMSYLEAYHVIDILSDKLPWFSSCVKAATFTEIGESYDVKEFLENGMQLSLPLRPDTRKELHFDLGTAALSENYGSIRPNAWRGAWTLIRNFMERNGFVHTQYSGYESKAAIPIDKALAVMGGIATAISMVQGFPSRRIAHRGRRTPRCPLLYQGFQWHHRSGSRPFAWA